MLWALVCPDVLWEGTAEAMTIDPMLRSAREVAYRVLDTVVVWLEVEVFDPLGRRFPQADWKFVAIFALYRLGENSRAAVGRHARNGAAFSCQSDIRLPVAAPYRSWHPCHAEFLRA